MELIILNCIIFLAVVYVGYVQHKQSKSQSELLSAFEKYSKIIDVDKLSQYVKFQEEASHSKAITLIENAIREEIHTEHFQKILRAELEDGKTNPAMLELMFFAAIHFASLSKEEREKTLSKMKFTKEAMSALLNMADSLNEFREVWKPKTELKKNGE